MIQPSNISLKKAQYVADQVGLCQIWHNIMRWQISKSMGSMSTELFLLVIYFGIHIEDITGLHMHKPKYLLLN